MSFFPSFCAGIATIAISMKSTNGPWGGSSVFVSQLADCLRRRGYRVQFRLDEKVDLVVLVDPRTDSKLKAFGTRELAVHKQRHPQTLVLHRVNECDQRKASTFMDPLLEEANALADHTVFISEWLREYHAARWFPAQQRPHSVIYNGADPAVFHPIGSARWKAGEPLRVVTHHWSDNPRKGFDVYAQIDELMAAGKLPGFELWIVGRWPKNMQWKTARTFPPLAGKALAALLRECHLYVTGTRWEPCGMHHVEGAQCGLPLLFHEDGGGVNEAGLRYGIGFREAPEAALETARENYSALRASVLRQMPSGDAMAQAYANQIQAMLAERNSPAGPH